MRGYTDTKTTYGDWYYDELEIVQKAYEIRSDDKRRVFYRKKRADAKYQPTKEELREAIAVLSRKLVKKPHPSLGRDINVQRVRPAIKEDRDYKTAILLIIATGAVMAIIALMIIMYIDVVQSERYKQFYIKPEVSPLQFYDYDQSESWLRPKQAHAETLDMPFEAIRATESNQNLGEVESIIMEYFGAENYATALRISKCESGLNPMAKNPNSSASGIFQIINSTWISNRQEMGLDTDLNLRFNAEENIKTAAYIYSRRGWQPWVCK